MVFPKNINWHDAGLSDPVRHPWATALFVFAPIAQATHQLSYKTHIFGDKLQCLDMKLIYRCTNSAEASVILNALLEEGIPAVEGESGTSSVFPLPNFGPTIHVDDQYVERAVRLIKELERKTQLTQKNESFRDVDHQEIEYLQTVHQKKGSNVWIWVLALVMLLGLFRAILYANGQGDWFSQRSQRRGGIALDFKA